ncbi:MAG: hypothetical protein M4579_001119 [Chaenotheca gracillima]|nr:MAG: hypothetical protein M4579_001119 [Chaenotheca gracillima]
MQYVRSISGSVSKTWNSINPATLSGAIDVIVIELDDGTLACSPFHVRFGKFSLLRPYEKKVEFRVNNAKQEYAMKLGEGGEAFFVFETSDDIPEALQTSPLISPTTSPHSLTAESAASSNFQEPEFLDLASDAGKRPPRPYRGDGGVPILSSDRRAQSDFGQVTPLSGSPEKASIRPRSGDWQGRQGQGIPLERSTSDAILPSSSHLDPDVFGGVPESHAQSDAEAQLDVHPGTGLSFPSQERPKSPPPLNTQEAVDRAKALSEKLSGSNIPTQVTESGDLMLDMTGYKSSEDDALRAEVIARKILAEELEGNYDIGALIGADERGNLWIYSSEEAKEAAGRRAGAQDLAPGAMLMSDSASDPGYHSDGDQSVGPADAPIIHGRREAGLGISGPLTPPKTPPDHPIGGDPNRNYAKTLRLTSDQLKALSLRPGANSMSFSVNRATCSAFMYYWKQDDPIVISDIDGTITKSDALGHVLNMIGRDWTHLGVAKLYTDIVANGYNIMYLTSRSVGQADTTRAYLNGIMQDSYKLPKGPVIMSPDRTIAALRREIYLRKPEVFKMACLRDILNLFGQKHNPFYAGFGNRLTDALSYRSVNIPSTRIFTINANAEVSLDMLTLNKYKSSYVTMREVVDHFFPPIGLLVKGGGESYTDFNYWRDTPLDLDDFSASESGDDDQENDEQSVRSEDEGSEGLEDDENADDLGESYMSGSVEDGQDIVDSILEQSMLEDDEHMEQSFSREEHTAIADENDAEDAEEAQRDGDRDDLLNVEPSQEAGTHHESRKGKEVQRKKQDVIPSEEELQRLSLQSS